jgi:hypothetical protein
VTQPKVNTIKRGDTRFYVSPTTGAKVPGVTSILNMLPKEFLKFWAAKLVAQEAVADLGAVVSIALRDPDAAIDYLKRAPDRSVKNSQDVGTAAHALFETLAQGKSVGRVHPDLEIYVRHFNEFLDVVQPEYHYLEETVWSDSHEYAGSFDAFATIQGERVWIDNKTTRSGIHEEVGIQLTAYGYADFLVGPDGEQLPMPQADGAAVLRIRPEGWQLTPVRYDDEVFDVFLHLRETFRYEKEMKSSMIGKTAFEGPAANAPTGPKRRAPRKPADLGEIPAVTA